MIKKRLLRSLAIVAAATFGVVMVVLWQSSSASVGGQTLPLLTKSDAVARAIEEAKLYGLQGDATGYVAKVMTMADYAAITGGKIGTGGPAVGLYPDASVWVVALRGRVEWSGPGVPGPREVFDNITIELDARTGEIKGHAAYYSGYTPALFNN